MAGLVITPSAPNVQLGMIGKQFRRGTDPRRDKRRGRGRTNNGQARLGNFGMYDNGSMYSSVFGRDKNGLL